MAFLVAVLVAPVLCVLAKLLVLWLANRPDAAPPFTPQEMRDDLEDVFVPRRELTFDTTFEYLPIILEKLTWHVDSGFETRHVKRLLERMETARMGSALYAIHCAQTDSDLEIIWCRFDDDRITVQITAIPKLAGPLTQIVKATPAEIRSPQP